MKKVPVTAGVLIAVSVASASPAMAATAYLNGLFGVGPGFSTITGPEGERCTHDCVRLRYDNLTDESAARALEKFVDENGNSGNTIFAFSLGTNGVLKHLAANPEDRNTYILLGSPSAPNSANPMAVPIPETEADVSFVTRSGDAVPQYGQKGITVDAHVNGYRYLDLRRDPVEKEQVSDNVDSSVYDGTAKLTWQERAEQRRADWKARVEAAREARAERAAASRQRWSTFIDRVFGKKETAEPSVSEPTESPAEQADDDQSETESES